MWPWEHVAIGYLGNSLLFRHRGYEPTSGTTVAVVFGSLFPDLVDKPLAWWLGILPAGRSLAHSLLFAVPLCVFSIWIAIALERRVVAYAFTIGYLLHLPADVVSPMLLGRSPSVDFLFWPAVSVPEQSGPGNFDIFQTGLLDTLLGPLGVIYVGFQLVLLGGAFLAWRADGYPGLELLVHRERYGLR